MSYESLSKTCVIRVYSELQSVFILHFAMKGTVIRVEPKELVEKRLKTVGQLLELGCSAKQATSLAYRIHPRKYLTEAEMNALGYC